jgi:hypothetical protein
VEEITEGEAAADGLLSDEGPIGDPVAAHAGPSMAAAIIEIAILRKSKAP